jgi:small subunit ribosomal protein S1
MSADETTPTPSSIDELAPRMELRGTVKRLELYGAFVDIGVGQDALLHISQLGKPNVRNVGDVVKEGEQITVYVLKVDKQERRVALSLVQPPAFNWDDLKEGMTVSGKVVRVENFGAFIDIGAERPGMVHVSELTDGFVKSPSDIVKVDQIVEARIIKINRKKRQIDMSMKTVTPAVEEVLDDEPGEAVPTAMELALRRAMEQNEASAAARRTKRQVEEKQKRMREQDDIIERTLRSGR